MENTNYGKLLKSFENKEITFAEFNLLAKGVGLEKSQLRAN